MSKPVDQERARAARRAAALFKHWRRDDSTDGVMALLQEYDETEFDYGCDEFTHLICALLEVGCNLIKASKEDREDWYLDYVLREAMLDEVGGRS